MLFMLMRMNIFGLYPLIFYFRLRKQKIKGFIFQPLRPEMLERVLAQLVFQLGGINLVSAGQLLKLGVLVLRGQLDLLLLR